MAKIKLKKGNSVVTVEENLAAELTQVHGYEIIEQLPEATDLDDVVSKLDALNIDGINTQLAETQRKKGNPTIVFTFDDNKAGDSLTKSIFDEFGFVCSFGVITNSMYGSTKNPIGNYYNYQKEGFEVLSHSDQHLNLSSSTDLNVITGEYLRSANRLRTMGFSANGLIVPFSTASATAKTIASQIYDYVLIGGSGLNTSFSLKTKTLTRISAYGSGVQGSKDLIDQAIETNSLLIFYDHEINAVDSLTEAQWREILTYAKQKTDSGVAVVKNVRDSISYYFGHTFPDRKEEISTNLAPASLVANTSTTDTTKRNGGWYVEATNGTIFNGVPIRQEGDTIRAVVDLTSPVGSTVEYQTDITLTDKFDIDREVVQFEFLSRGDNSQYTRFDTFMSIKFYDASNVLLSSSEKQIYLMNLNTSANTKSSLVAHLGINTTPANVAYIRCGFKFVLNQAITAHQGCRMSRPKIYLGA